MTEINRIFKVNGKPFFPIGTETVYAGYAMKPNEHENVFRDLKSINGNSMAIPVHWDAIEPEEGKFDFSSVDILITNARKYGLKLILLWFGTWKNGGMEYVPEWIKTDPKRFRRALNAQGKDMWSLSPFCKATLESDKKAFIALMKYLKSKDSVEQTVISIQVENEPGIVGTDRDYSPEGEKIYKAPVPPDFIAAMKKYGKGATWELWQAAGAKKQAPGRKCSATRRMPVITCMSGTLLNSSMPSPKPAKRFTICRCSLICGRHLNGGRCTAPRPSTMLSVKS